MNKILLSFFIIVVASFGCEGLIPPVEEIGDNYRLTQGTALTVILQNPLNSSENHRGDQFSTRLKESISLKNHTILPINIEIKGIVKRVDKFERFGDRASLLLIFDQIVMQDSIRIPMSASLDTKEGTGVIKMKG